MELRLNLTVDLTLAQRHYLEQMIATGLYGDKEADVVRFSITEAILQAISSGIVEQLEEPEKLSPNYVRAEDPLLLLRTIETAPKDQDVLIPVRMNVRSWWDDENQVWRAKVPVKIDFIPSAKGWYPIGTVRGGPF